METYKKDLILIEKNFRSREFNPDKEPVIEPDMEMREFGMPKCYCG